VDAAPDVVGRPLEDVGGRVRGRLEGHRDPPDEVQPVLWPEAGDEARDRGRHDQRDEEQRQPETAGVHSSWAPLMFSRNRQSSVSAARRHMTIRPRKISKYSMTWLISVSIVSSSVTVRADESTRRKDCSAAKFTRSWMSKSIWADFRTLLRCTSDLSARITAAATGPAPSPPGSSWLPTA